MPSIRQIFLSSVGQTSEQPLMLEVDRALGVYIYDTGGKEYIDLNSGISVSSLGHCHPAVIEAIRNQSEKYLHTMVYGEHVQMPQIQYAQLLFENIDKKYESVYYLMAGTEATELAMKIAKRTTNRYEIISCKDAYHGSTQGAESLQSDLNYKSAYFPMLPGIKHMQFNDFDDISQIDVNTAAVIIEAVQAEAGIVLPDPTFLKEVEKRCAEVSALLILDEIQTGFGRTGHLFAHQKYDILPDLILIGKAMGGGMPISGVVGSKNLMNSIVKNPSLGHITTFGGHPVSCAAAHATLRILLDQQLVQAVEEKEALFIEQLNHPIVKEIRSSGLMMAVELTKRKYLKHVINKAFELGALIDYFLFNDRSFRLASPLVISESEIKTACEILLEAMDYAEGFYVR